MHSGPRFAFQRSSVKNMDQTAMNVAQREEIRRLANERWPNLKGTLSNK